MDLRKKPKILFFITEDWYFWSHRLPLARAMKDEGFEVLIATCVTDHGDRIKDEGFKLLPLRLNRSGKNPFQEIVSIIEIIRLYRRERPDIAHHVALKPVIYGAIAARFAGISNVVNALAGLGHVFSAKGLRASLVRFVISNMLRPALRQKKSRVIFQNPDDRDLFVSSGLVAEEQAALIKGAGVDTDLFAPSDDLPDGKPVALFASRMLWTKGVGEFVQMARELKKNNIDARVALAGSPDYHNPAAVPESELNKWDSEGVIEYWGKKDNMPAVMKSVSIVVLPSHYGEGVPKVLIEGAAAGKPLVAFDIPGCREIVRHGENGYLIPPGAVDAMYDAIRKLLLDPALRNSMGMAGRKIALEHFSERQVVKETLDLYKSMRAEPWPDRI